MKIKLLAILTVCAVLLTTTDLSAQRRSKGPFTIKWGDPARLPKGHRALEYFSGDKSYYQLTQSKRLVGVVGYDQKLNENGYSIMDKPRSKYMRFETMDVWNNSPMLFFSDYDKKAKSEKLLMIKINPQTGDLSGEPEEVLASNGKIQPIGGKKFHVVVPQAGDDLLVYYMSIRESRKDSKNKDKYTFAVYDSKMEMKWSQEVKMPYVEANMRIIGHRVMNNKVYTFSYVRKSGKGDEYDNMAVLEIAEGSDDIKVHKVESPKGIISNIILSKYSEGSNIVFTGLLKNKKASTSFQGYFVGLFDVENPASTNFNSFDFSPELISANESARSKRKMEKSEKKGKEPGIPLLEMRSINRRSDGGYYIVMEQYYLYVQRIKAGNVTIIIYHYYFMDVLISSISADGKEEWIKKIAKHQYYVNSTYLAGLGTFMLGDDLLIFFNDHNKNKNLGDDDVPTTHTLTRDGLLMCARVTPDGEIVKSEVTDLKDEEKVINPLNISEISPGVYFGGGKEYKNKNDKRVLSSRPFIIELKEKE